MIEIITQSLGYLASLLLAISLLINNDLKFRWLNTFGCISFILYGLYLHAFPILLTNIILLLINLYYLVRIYRTHEDFELLEFVPGDQVIGKFLSFYKADIDLYFPEFKMRESENAICFIVLRDLVIANIFVADSPGDGTAHVQINYTVSRYRDFEVGKFIFKKENNFLLSKGIRRIVYDNVHNKQHAKFLRVMGFTGGEGGRWWKELG